MRHLTLTGLMIGACAGAAQAQSSCQPGSYDPGGGSNCIPAPAGRFVPTAGATAAILAAPGSYVPLTGQTSATLAQPGFFVPTAGATAETPAPPGSFVSNSGAVAATPAPPGFFVANAGAAAATPAPLGSFVALPGQTAAVPAPAGSFVAATGQSAATPAPPGFYVPQPGQTAAIQAAPGFFVPTSGAVAPTPAPIGYYVAGAGAVAPTPVDPGFYAPTTASTAQIGAGMLSQGLNMTAQGTRQVLDSLDGAAAREGLHATLLGARSQTTQAGLSGASQLRWRGQGVALQATGPRASGFLALLDQTLDGLNAGSGSTQLWLAGASYTEAGGWMPWRATVFTGQGKTEGLRQVTELASPERYGSTGSVDVLGVQWSGSKSLPMANTTWVLQVGATQFKQKGFTETAQSAGTIAGLTVAQSSWMSLPWFTGLTHQWRVVDLRWGVRSDLQGTTQLQASPTRFPGHGHVNVPVGQSGSSAWVAKLRLKPWHLQEGLSLQGQLAVEKGSRTQSSQAQLVLSKRW